MKLSDGMLNIITGAAEVALATLLIWAGMRLADRLFPEESGANDHHYRFKRQVIKMMIVAGGLVLLLIVLPVSDSTRGQLFGLFGLVLTAMIALGSTSFVSNAMAGIMLRSVGNFRPGDFVRVGEHSGRVSERGLFHTEIQTEDRDLTTLPNLYLVQQPVTVIRSSGTIVSASVSLGYDVPHEQAKAKLLEATQLAELKDGFVRISELLDHAVLYRVYGFLEDTKKILFTRSRLREEILNTLHVANIEITSPSHMIQRRLSEEENTVPDVTPGETTTGTQDTGAEELIFDKAAQAEKTETLRQRREELNSELQAIQKAAKKPEDGSVAPETDKLQKRIDKLDALIADRASRGKSKR